MNTRFALLAAACSLSLAACSNKPSPSTEESAAPAPTATTAAPASETEPAASPAPAESAASAPAPAESAAAPAEPTTAPAATGGDKPAVVAGCATEIAGTDAMQYDVNSITVPASCKEFKITLKHAGKMPVVAMGHNVVISKLADMPGVTTDGMAAGANNNYVKLGDARVIAHTKLVGGGETTSVSFAVSKIKSGGPYEFFCSFPGHSAMMKGTIAVQ
jgi:azurin